MLGMWGVGDVECWRCEMLGMWDVGDVAYWGCGMLGMWGVRDVGCWGCGVFGMWDVWDVECGKWIYKMSRAIISLELLTVTNINLNGNTAGSFPIVSKIWSSKSSENSPYVLTIVPSSRNAQ